MKEISCLTPTKCPFFDVIRENMGVCIRYLPGTNIKNGYEKVCGDKPDFLKTVENASQEIVSTASTVTTSKAPVKKGATKNV